MKNSFKAFLLTEAKTIINDPEAFIYQVKRDCKAYLQCSSKEHSLYRGMYVYDKFLKSTIRTDRRPSATPEPAHKVLDNFFKTHFGFNYRSAALFTLANPDNTRTYGKPYHVFPVKNYMLCGSLLVDDLYVYVNPSQSERYNTLVFETYILTARLDKDQLAEYNKLKTSKEPADVKRFAEITTDILEGLEYFQRKTVSSFDNSPSPLTPEIMVRASSYYACSTSEREVFERIYEK